MNADQERGNHKKSPSALGTRQSTKTKALLVAAPLKFPAFTSLLRVSKVLGFSFAFFRSALIRVHQR
jgi:hypothetical protein